MPACAREIDGKARVVECGTSKLVRRNGTPVDGGGHESVEKAREQAAAINASESD